MGTTSSSWHEVHEDEVYHGIQITNNYLAKKFLGPIESKFIQTPKHVDAKLIPDAHNWNEKISIRCAHSNTLVFD